mmetsp:Transcript_31238/g.35557  ORF Transcript_31238/g.35557 Transcript_31238/m.35557 type:complete len:623 (-) Transcript_31238:270-2138(-)|eukprot:CAMPEP_0194168858 /NCGR_PEP_ID=MMETSP0154-20130528/3648_1 /TAXON_ID=1049557 /ORGANISM="Thalassiothrix antarctica, Strain L6-D1" /LENGTH=622 /DNA_ID=CAMNT_0038880059 /DNA_START=56 /DNA_END=1924 /DNA_ORIENTATION=+
MSKYSERCQEPNPTAFDCKDDDDSGSSEFDENDDDDFDDDDDDSSFWSNFKAAWKHHVFAIIIAILAASIGLPHLQQENELLSQIESTTWQKRESIGFDPISHAHLETYKRMANISFCYDKEDTMKTKNSKNYFSFHLSVEHLSILAQHYIADNQKDDYYHNSVGKGALSENDNYHQHISKELACAHQQTAGKSLLTGWAPYYQVPSAEEIVPKNKDLLISTSKRNPFEKESAAASLSFTGFAAKFINLSKTPKLLFWDGRGGGESAKRLVAEIAPMESVGTATTPGQSFSITPVFDSSHALKRWTLTADEAIQVYRDDPDALTPNKLSHDLWVKYQMQELNLAFARDYLVETKRHWLANFPRPPPSHFMWPAEYLGQIHKVNASFTAVGAQQKEDKLLKLEVSSVSPRVLEINNFLTEEECLLLINSAREKGLHPSTVVGSGSSKDDDDSMVDSTTRSSRTTWLSRSNYKFVDSLYRRAADVLQVEDSALRHLSAEFIQKAKHHSTAEDLQIVHYANGQEYAPHHDFVYPSIADRFQPTRFATLLIYLQESQRGGETTFPRAIQTNNHDGLVVKPKQGKAILFYNMLPDGNVDDVSQHGSKPVEKGDKWIANLWIWDPIID